MNKMENLNKKLKNNKGSIMSFTLISMMFFLVVVIAIYASVNTKVQKQQKELNTIQKSYEQQEQINDIYEKKYNDYINSETSTLQVYADNNLKGEVKGQKKNTLGTVYTNIAQNKIKIFGGANSTYAYSETADGKRQIITGNEIPIQATKDGKTIYTWVKGEDGEYTKYYTAVTVKLSTLQDKTIYVAEGKSIDIGEINGENKGKITYDNIDNNMIKIENNQITGIKAGNTTFTATESNGGAQATITVKITKLTLEIQKGITILGTNKIIEVSGTNYGALTVKSNDETIAKATVNGTQVTIIPQKVGTIKITITEQNAGASIDYEIQIANVILAPNGGKYTMPTTGKATLKTQVKVENANKIEVAWTSSNLEWKTIENNSEITKKDCDKGTYYLYVKIDNEVLYQSKAFIVGEEKIAINIKTSTTEWTNKDIIATIEYPDVTVNNTRKAGYGTTLNDAQTAAKSATAPTTSVTVTANGYVFATATDAAGNVVTASQQITNIDKEAPTITSVKTGEYTTYSDTATITANDTSKIVAYGISKNENTQPTDWISTNKIDLTNVPVKVENGATWARVFYHNCVNGSELFTSEAEALSTNSRYKFSVLSSLKNYRNSNGDFEFLLQYPNDTNKYNRWIQTDNPTEVTLPYVSGNTTVKGYQAIHIDWTGYYWGGLYKSENTKVSLINGSAGHGEWFYAIGAYSKYSLGIPSYDSTATVTELWTRIDNLEAEGKKDLNATIGNITENGTYYAWVKDIAGNISSKEFTVNKVDKTAPEITSFETNNTEWTNQDVTLTVNANDNESGLYTSSPYGWNSASVWSWYNNNQKSVSENGKYTVYVRNAVGNVSSKSITVNNIDKTAPTMPVITAKIGSDTGSAYTSGTWTNQPVVITATSTDEQSQINRIEYSYDNATWKTDWGTNLVTRGNQKSIKGTWNSKYNTTIYVRAIDNVGNASDSSSIVLRQEKIAPTVTLSPNGGSYAIPTSGKATIKTTLTAEDTGDSGLKTLQYAWSTSNTTEPTNWTTFKSGDTVSKTDCTEGTYYLWTNVYDNAGNKATTVKVSGGFIVGTKTITITPSTTTLTNQNITATITYPDETTASTRKAGYGITLNNAQTAAKSATAPTTSVTVTANGYVFATATDAAGNEVTASRQITNIDKEAPTISKTEVKNVTTTGYDVYVYGVQDSGSGVNRVQFPTWTTANGQDDIQSNWTTNITAKGTKQSDGTTWIYHVNVTDHNNEAGEYNTHVYVYDNLGNSKSISTHLITVPAVEITYDNNYLNKNLWNDTQDLSRYYSATTAPSSKINVDNESALFGKTIEFTMNAGNGGGPYYANNTALTVGKTYTWSVYVKTNTNRTMRIGQEQGGRVDLKVTTEWQKFTYTFTAVSRNVKAFIFYSVGQNWSAGDKLYIHSLEIEEGDGSSNKTKENKGYNSKLGTLDIPTRTGYTFDGWYTDPTGGTKITSETTTPASNTTYYAHWTINEYTIDLNFDVDSTTYWSGYNSRIYVGFKIGGVDKGYIQDYREKSPYGTKWEIYGARLDGINVAYTDSGTLGAESLDLRAKFYTLTLAVNNTEYGSITPTNLIVPRNNTTYSVNGTKLTLSDGRTANASVTDATGYTTTLTGWSPTRGTISQATTVTANITRTPNQYTLTINPNGGKYNNTTANSTFVQSYDTVKNIGTASPPSSCTITYNGNGGTASKSADTSNKAFSGWTKSGTGEYISTTAPSTTSGFVRTAKYDTSNGNYDNFKYSLSSAPTANTWYLIRYPVYTYTSGHTYEIRYKLRINSVVASGLYFRHAAVFNDYGTAGSVTNTYTTATNGWVDVVQTRTISGATIELGSNKLNVTPMFEIYTTNLKNSMASADFDVKDLMIIDKTSDKLLQGNANLFWYKNGNGTLTANYTAFAKIKLATATKKGYTFSGWYDATTGGNKIGDANADYTPTESKTLYAHYNANTYTINYNGNGATSGSTASSTHTYDVAKKLTANGFSKSGYTFLGWSTNASATSATYTNSQSVKNLTETANGSITLYAIWKDATAPTMLTPTIIPTSWTNGNVTISSGARDSGSLIRAYQWSTSPNITATSSGWINLNTMSEAITQSYTAKENGTYYFYAKDGSGNVGVTSIKISTIDRTAPSANISLNSTTATTDGSVTATVTHSDTGGSGVKISGSKWVLNTTSGNIGTNASSYTGGTFSSNPQSITLKATTIGNYYLHVLTVDNAGNAKETISDRIEIIGKMSENVQIGDYVEYNATNNYSYTSSKGSGSSHGNGYGSQKFTSSSEVKWRVLSKNSSTGEVVLISENPIGNFTLNGAIGYLYAEEELNRICSIYGYGVGANTKKVINCTTGDIVEGTKSVNLYGSGAKSINANDINEIVGYNPVKGTTYTKSIYYPTRKTSTGVSTLAATRTEQSEYYSYKGSDYLKDTTSSLYKMIFGNSANYWLASRSVTSYPTDTYYDIRRVVYEGISSGLVFYGYSNGHQDSSVTRSIRPIVYLRSDCFTEGKNSDGAWTISNCELLANKVNWGDYVAYDATSKYSNSLQYISPEGNGKEHGNGYSNQKFTAKSNMEWRVLETDSETGDLVLISAEEIQTDNEEDFCLKGATGYLYAEQELNNICSIYGHGVGADTNQTFKYTVGDKVDGESYKTITGSGARSITIDDINSFTRFTPEEDANIGEYGENITHTIFYPTINTTSGFSTVAKQRTDTNTGYYYWLSSFIDPDSDPDMFDMLCGNYWMASRYIRYGNFSIFSISEDEKINENEMILGTGSKTNFINKQRKDWY